MAQELESQGFRIGAMAESFFMPLEVTMKAKAWRDVTASEAASIL